MRMTASDILSAIGLLPQNRAYNYVNPKTPTKIEIEHITYPEGPIKIRRYDPSKGGTHQNAKLATISVQMIWRIANALIPNHPINFDRMLGGSYNTRSALEALLAHTSQFYYSYPGRVEVLNSSTNIKRGHKHLIWRPENPHEPGIMKQAEADIVISEIPAEVFYESLTLPDASLDAEIDIEIQRRHAQIQVALIIIGRQLGNRIWVAHNDRGIIYNNQRIGEIDGVVVSLRDEKILQAYSDAINAARYIDCIWFHNDRFMPAVFEVEHSTGVTRGLVRMKSLQDAIPPIQSRWVIAAPNEERERVIREANKEQFHSLQTQYLPYSAVEELYYLCQRRNLRGVSEEFLDCFMEHCIN